MSFRSRCQVVSTELFPPVVIVPSRRFSFPVGRENTYRHNCYNPLTANAGLMTENLVLFEAYACTESGNDPLIFH